MSTRIDATKFGDGTNWHSRYAHLDWRWQHHHERFLKYLASLARPLICQECGGSGDLLIDEVCAGDCCYPIYADCGFCEGTGKIDARQRGRWLRYRKDVKHGRSM